MMLLNSGPDSIMNIFMEKQLPRSCCKRGNRALFKKLLLGDFFGESSGYLSRSSSLALLRITSIYLLAMFAVLLGHAVDVSADQVSWVGDVTGYWGEGTNWSTGMVPGAGDDVVVDLGEPVTIFHETGETIIASLSMIGKLDLQGGSFTLAGNGTIDGELAISNGAALIASGAEADMVVLGVVDIGSGDILAIDGGHISLPSVIRYQGGGRLRAEGSGSVLELANLESIGIGEPEPIDSLYDAISREYSCYQYPLLPEEEYEKGIFVSYSREVSVYQRPAVPAEGSEKGILETYSREISGYQRPVVPVEGSEKGILETYSREISGYQRPSVPVEGYEMGIFEIYSREISGFQQQPGLVDEAETVVIEAISREVSLEHLTPLE